MNKWTLLFFLIANLANGQDVIVNAGVGNTVQLSDEFELHIPQNQNQYIASQWSKGKLFYANGTSKKYDSLNFDRYGNKVEVVVNNKALSVLPMGLSGGLIYSTDNSGSLFIVGKIAEEARFLIVLSSGKYLLASYLISTAPSDELNYKTDEVRFVPKKKTENVIRAHYVIFENEKWKSFKLSKSALSKLFKEDKKMLQSTAVSEGINTSTEIGLIQLFDFLNDN